MTAETEEVGSQAAEENPQSLPLPVFGRGNLEIWDASSPLAAQRVVSEPEAARFIGLSLPQLRRQRQQGRAPAHVQLSERRLGYRVAALIAFLDSRTVSEKPQAILRGSADADGYPDAAPGKISHLKDRTAAKRQKRKRARVRRGLSNATRDERDGLRGGPLPLVVNGKEDPSPTGAT